MSSNYLDMMRRQAGRRARGFQFTSKNLLVLLAIVGMGASAVYWWGVQSGLTDNRVVAVAFTAILVLAPPSLVSFLIPWSPGGMLLQKVNARTWGYGAVICASLYLIWYSYQLQYSWWAAQPIVRDSGLIGPQVFVGIIGFIIIPALLWTPVTSEELVEQVRQAHLVKRYELQTQADIAILRATLLRAQEKALIGFANLTVEEREELAGVMKGLVTGIDRTLREVGESVHRVSGAMVPFEALEDNDDVQEILEYIGGSLTSGNMRAIEDTSDRRVSLRDVGIDDRSAESPAYVETLRADNEQARIAEARGRADEVNARARGAGQSRARDAAPIWHPPSAADRAAMAREFAAAEAGDSTTARSPRIPAAPVGELPPPGIAANRGESLRFPAEYQAAREQLRGVWSDADLGKVIGKHSRTARDRIAAWEDAGLVDREKGSANSYYFTERLEVR